MTKKLFKCISATKYFRIGKIYEMFTPEMNGIIGLINEDGHRLYVKMQEFEELPKKRVYQREYHKAYREKNRDILNERSKKFSESHREELKQRAKEYRQLNKERVRQYEASRWPRRKEQRRLKREALKLEKQNLSSHE